MPNNRIADLLAFRFAHPAEHAHQRLVRRITGVELSTQLRYPQVHAVGSEPGCDQGELVAEPAPGALSHDHRIPFSVRVLQRGEQPRGVPATFPRHGVYPAAVPGTRQEEVHLHRLRPYAHAAWLFEQAFWFVTFLAVGNK
jgi:hypothetical protein